MPFYGSREANSSFKGSGSLLVSFPVRYNTGCTNLESPCIFVGAGGETRTLMSVTSPDFESGAYTNFATPAQCGFDGQAILVAAATPRQLFGIGPNSVLLARKDR